MDLKRAKNKENRQVLPVMRFELFLHVLYCICLLFPSGAQEP